MEIRVFTFFIINLSILYSWVHAQCSSEYSYTDPIEGVIQSQQHQLDLKNQQTIAFGFWMTLRPEDSDNLPLNPEIIGSPSKKELFLFSFEEVESKTISLLLYSEISLEEQKITHILLLLSGGEMKTLIEPMDYETYEGNWFFVYFLIELIESEQSIRFDHYNLLTKSTSSQIYHGLLSLYSNMESIRGGYKNVYFNETLNFKFQAYPGYIQQVILEYQDYKINSYVLSKRWCQPQNGFSKVENKLVDYNTRMTGNIITDDTFTFFHTFIGYTIQGWIKQDQLTTSQSVETVLLRISRSDLYFKDSSSQVGDKIIYVKYFQNTIDPSQNGFSLETYTSEYPWKTKPYIPQNTDTLLFLNEKYQNLHTKWHFFQFQFGTHSNSLQPIYKVYYSAIDTTVEYNWGKKINHFTSRKLYFSIGGDQYSVNKFKGYLSDWVYRQLQKSTDVTFVLKCHYTCQTCNGISEQDCTSCSLTSLRVYSSSQNTCKCKYGYIDKPLTTNCFEMYKYYGPFQYYEREIKIAKKGYYSEDRCDFGYFTYNKTCIECPYAVQDNLIQCADCILYPDIFSQNLKCTFQFNSSDKFSTFNQYQYNTEEKEQYTIQQTNDLKFQLKKRIGHQDQLLCKEGYFLDDKEECQPCTNNCELCFNNFSCERCQYRYNLIESQFCVECENCMYVNNVISDVFFSSVHYCPDRMYLFDDFCYDCSSHCQLCSYEVCYFCDDEFFITLDKKNCAKCSIQNCQYCFQYTINSDKSIETSLDLKGSSNFIVSEIITGCALCYNNYFYSFVTQKCEPKPSDMTDCESGVFIDNQGTSKCLVSQTRADAIQQSTCNDELCLSCINNYSLQIDQFCIVCKGGYYPAFLTGQCKKCPENCLICAEYNSLYEDQWKWKIRAFYKVFINPNNAHPFETNQIYYLNVFCLTCLPNFQLIKNVCLKVCSDDCIDCRTDLDLLLSPYLKCNQCQPQTYNKQRSVDQNNTSQCLTCPEYCSACHPRTPEQITAINPFFNQTSPFLKYSHICYETDLQNQQGTISILPYYIVPNVCQQYEKCEKIFQVTFYMYCDSWTQYLDYYAEPNKYLRTRYQSFPITQLEEREFSNELFQSLNQIRITEIIFDLEIRKLPNDQDCQFTTSIINYSKKNVFTLQTLHLILKNSKRNQFKVIPIEFLMQQFITNFNTITFQEIQFYGENDGQFKTQKQAEISFENEYDPIGIRFENCEIKLISEQNIFFFVTFRSSVLKELLISQMNLWGLRISNSSIFSLLPSEQYSNANQQIENFWIKDSNFSNSSIFFYNAEFYSLQLLINFTNVSISNTIFQNSSFINSSFSFDYTIGEITLENFHLENLIFKDNSKIFNIANALSLNVKNITIQNVIFLDTSSFLVCNVLSIDQLLISSSVINQGHFIKIKQQTMITKSLDVTTKQITFFQITFINNTYSSEYSNHFISILQTEFNKYNLNCSNLFLDNNVLTDSQIGKSTFSFVSYKYSLIYIECNNCLFDNLKIFRGVGLPEISIINSQQLLINNLYIETKQQYLQKILHSSAECSKKYIYQDIPFFIYILSYINVQISNAQVQKTIIADFQLIILIGRSRIESIQQESITIFNSSFRNNQLLTMNENRQSSIISIETQQVSLINIQNVEFQNNLLNQYYQNSLLHSSATLLIHAEYGEILFQSLQFTNNVITNSSDSVLYVMTKSLRILDCNFMNQNFLTNQQFLQSFIISKSSTLKLQDIDKKFQILSLGGNGQIETSYLFMKNISIINTQAIHGGGFYITTLGDGIIKMINCSFKNTSTILNQNQLASGGLFYIDSSKSILNLTISNCLIQSSYSRTYGGAIYIEPSRTFNQIFIENSIIHSVFSIQHSFLSFSPKKQIAVASEIKLSNLEFQNTQLEFEKFASQLSDLQEQNVVLFQTDNPLIYAQFTNIILVDCQFQYIHLAYLLEIFEGIEISLQNVKIMNCNTLQSPLIKLNLRPDTKGYIQLKNIFIQGIEEYSHDNLICQQNPFVIFELVCPLSLADIQEQPIIYPHQEDYTETLKCNLNSLYQIIQSQIISLIELSNLKPNHFLFINQLIMSEVQCKQCSYGIFSIKQFEDHLNLQLLNIQFLNNICGVFGCLSIIKSINETNTEITQASKFQESTNIFDTTLNNGVFINNSAQYGGACFLSRIDILINNTKFLGNQAALYGGAIYYDSDSTILLTLNSWIVQNKAQIGGAIYFKNQQMQELQNLNLVIEENHGFTFANNLFEVPRYLYLSLDRMTTFKNILLFSNSTTIIEQIFITPFQSNKSQTPNRVLLLPSGISITSYKYFNHESNSYVKLNQSLRVFAQNIFGERIANLQNSECLISSTTINISKPVDYLNFTIVNTGNHTSKSNVVFNMNTGDYNLDELIVYFNPYQDEKLQLQLAFQCNSVQIPFYNTSSNRQISVITNYILLLNVRTYSCQLGEYLNITSGGCVLCDIQQSQYSVTINASLCTQKDETKISEIQPAMIKLKPFYWRAYYYSDIIEICHNLQANCEGGWFAGNPSCATGHIGALCEQCDLYNIKGQGEYSQNQSYQCSNCDESATNILNIIFVVLWTLISVFITVISTIKMIDDFVLQIKLNPFRSINVALKVSTSALLKIFTNYLQIVSSIASFQLTIPIGMTLAFRGLGNPVGSSAFSLDCYLKSVSDIPILYFRIIWGFIMVTMYILLFLLFHVLEIIVLQKKFNITFVSTILIYIYIYLSPNLVSELSFLVSYRDISGQQWIAANVAYLYNTDLHKNWLFYFFTPCFSVIAIILPFFFWYIVYHNRLKLNTKKVKTVWGYLYNEYKSSAFYWETIKIIQKELIILILIYYEDYIPIKACLIFFLLHLYSKLTQTFKPYLTVQLNSIDSLSTSICQISIVLAQSIYLAQGLNIQEVVWPFYIVLGIINFYFIFEIISKLLSAYFVKFNDSLNRLRQIIFTYLPNSMKKTKFCMRNLQNTTERKFIIRQRYQKLRRFLIYQAKFIIGFKKKNNMGLESQLTVETPNHLFPRLTTFNKTLPYLQLHVTETQ